MRLPGIDAVVAFLSRPEAYPDKPGAVERIETHMSWVFLTDHHAYKLKKPVRYAHLDFSTPELRRHDGQEELRLNRRLAPDVYLGLVALRWDPERGLALQGTGEPIDWLVWMRRLPADRMLDARIRSGAVEEREVRRAALELGRFYVRATRCDVPPAEYCRSLERGVRRDRLELCRPGFGLPREVVEGLAAAQLAFLAEHADLFHRRAREGYIVEGHGDLRPEHICLVPEPVIIDCLEFSRELRIVDPADELAFLSLECERLGNPAVGRWFLDAYSELSGDVPPPPLLRFHRIYRALRRAVLAAWHLQDPSVRDAARWHARARRYLELAAGA